MNRLLASVILLVAGAASATGAPKFKRTVPKFGTINWLMKTIKASDLDTVHGYKLGVTSLASGNTPRVALLADEVDAIVADRRRRSDRHP